MWSETLNVRESAVMRALLTLSAGRERFLVSPGEVLAVLPGRAACDEPGLERVLHTLELDGYLHTVQTDRKGEKTYVVCLREKGLSFLRDARTERRRLVRRLLFTALCGLASALAGILLKLALS